MTTDKVQHLPHIGITSADPLPENYIAAIKEFGMHPNVLRSSPENMERDLGGLQGLLISGGADIDPEWYGEPQHSATDPGDGEQDSYELGMVRLATERGMPILMICRGLQIGNVTYGGTLFQHIPDLESATINHFNDSKYEALEDHMVTVESDSMLAKIIGSTNFATNASHHQAVDRVGVGLRVVARTDDGIVEALERPDADGFWLAVQWHPERLLRADQGRSLKIFRAFYEAARAYHASTLMYQLP